MDALYPVVRHDEFPVRHFFQQSAHLFLGCGIMREVRRNDIVVEVVKVFVEEILHRLHILLVQENRNLGMIVEPLCHRVEEYLLVCAEFVEYRQNLQFVRLHIIFDKEALTLMRLQEPLVPKYRICFLYRFLRDFVFLSQLVH